MAASESEAARKRHGSGPGPGGRRQALAASAPEAARKRPGSDTEDPESGKEAPEAIILPKIPAEEVTRIDPGSKAGSSGLEEEAVKEVERPSLLKIPAKEDTRLDPGSGTEKADRKDDEKLICSMEEFWRQDVWAMAEERSISADVKRRYVNELLAQWHPDRSGHGVATSKRVSKAIQEEVNDILTKRAFPLTDRRSRSKAEEKAKEVAFRPFRAGIYRAIHGNVILAGRAAEEEAEEEAGSSGTEEEAEEEEAEEEADWDFEDFGDYEEDPDEESDDEEEESEGKTEEEAEEEAGCSAPEEEAVKKDERPSLSQIPADEEVAGGSGLEEEAVKEVERPSLPKIPAEEDTRIDPGSDTEEGAKKDGRIERPSLPKIPAEEDTRLDPGSGTEKAGKEEFEEEAGSSGLAEEAVKEVERPSLPKIPVKEDTRLDPGSGTEEAVKKDGGPAGREAYQKALAGTVRGSGNGQEAPEAPRKGPRRKNSTPAEQCKYFGSAQGCKFGADCVFKHEDPTFVGPCKYQAHGQCKFEGRCFFRHTDLDKPKKEKQNDATGAAAEVAAKEAEAAWRYAAEERRKGYDEGFKHGAALEKAKAEGFEQGVAFARDCAEQAARATAEEGEQRKAATESRKAAEERLAALASETATALQKKGAQDKELAKAEEAKAKAKKRAKEEGRKQEVKKKRKQADAQGPPVPIPPCPHKKTTKARWSPIVAKSAFTLLLGVLAAYSGAAMPTERATAHGTGQQQEQGSSMTTEALMEVTHHQTTALSRFLSDDARYEARPDYAPSKTQNREVDPLWRICWACLGVGLFLGSWRTSGFYCGRTPATAGWRTVRAAGFVARCATRSARLWKPWLRLESGAGSGSCERSSGAWGAGRANLPAGRSAPAAPD
jgi:hypothetical protein